MKISALKCAVIGSNPVVRIVTDEGIDGYGQIEATKLYLKPVDAGRGVEGACGVNGVISSCQ